MYKPVTTDDIYSATDGSREKTVMTTPKAKLVNTDAVSQNSNASEAEALMVENELTSSLMLYP